MFDKNAPEHCQRRLHVPTFDRTTTLRSSPALPLPCITPTYSENHLPRAVSQITPTNRDTPGLPIPPIGDAERCGASPTRPHRSLHSQLRNMTAWTFERVINQRPDIAPTHTTSAAQTPLSLPPIPPPTPSLSNLFDYLASSPDPYIIEVNFPYSQFPLISHPPQSEYPLTRLVCYFIATFSPGDPLASREILHCTPQ